MADVAPAAARPAYLGRLHMRLAGNAFDASKPNERLGDAALAALYQDPHQNYIRSKYKGNTRVVADPDDDPDGGMAVDPVTHTSGIPIFGRDDAAARAGWSRGHTEVRAETTEALRAGAPGGDYSVPFLAHHVSAENSHALGHGDYGTDHMLSAPSASKAQNTEQLAIELGMRAAAEHLNAGAAGVDAEHSLVHAKITDVLHPHSGRLMARRFKLIRRANADDHEGTVVFDHLMDGNRLHISRDEAFALGQRAHDSLVADPVAAAKPHGGGGVRKGIGGAVAPTASELRDHQSAVLAGLQAARPANIGERATSRDRAAVPMVGPAFTGAYFPADAGLDRIAGSLDGEDALTEMRTRAVGHHTPAGADAATVHDVQTRYLTSGSVPADEDSTLLRGVQAIRANFHRNLGTREPTMQQIRDYHAHHINDLMEAHTIAHNSGGDRSVLRPDEREMLEEVDALRARVVGD
ncbi:MAG: hypothetical protein ABJN40_17910 [Sneathiella sp.]